MNNEIAQLNNGVGQLNDGLNVEFTQLNKVSKHSHNELPSVEFDDIQEEISLWTSSVICHIVGVNPPLSVFERFVRRISCNLLNHDLSCS